MSLRHQRFLCSRYREIAGQKAQALRSEAEAGRRPFRDGWMRGRPGVSYSALLDGRLAEIRQQGRRYGQEFVDELLRIEAEEKGKVAP